MNKDFISALEEIEKSKGVTKEFILDALEKGLVKSYQKNYDNHENVEITINKDSGEISVFSKKEVVDQALDDVLEISLDDAKNLNSKYKIGDFIRIKIEPKNFGRVAAQTARNIVIQQIRNAERDSIYEEYLGKEHELITGQVQRIDNHNVYFNLGKIEGIMPLREQVQSENYQINDRLKLYIKEVKNTTKEPQIILSRADKGLVVRLFELEVPEIMQGDVEIYEVSREAGSRTKIAVFSNDKEIDAIGSCIGYKGNRVNAIVSELRDEKIDIVNYDKDIEIFVTNALNPAQVVKVLKNDRKNQALAVVKDDELSLAIGKEGQNVRLAAKLTGWKIDIKSQEEFDKLSPEEIDEILQLNVDKEDDGEKNLEEKDPLDNEKDIEENETEENTY
ncbi:MAG: transcription termination factor NusA [Peptoniphilaceae bacterium]|nr:transcription termination factor NusA [Peptoniphilaceae bacterium]MDD7382993.1 transcription termination factor NusA [Peptoniphilaceae bacterium]MDY3737744.1 transcription termination factor NusA [Peptoniphilaceae bacterium]